MAPNMDSSTSLQSSGSIRIEGFTVSHSVESPFASVVGQVAAKKPAVESPFSKLLKADSCPMGVGALKLKVPKLPPRPLKTAVSTAGEAAPRTMPCPTLRKAQSCDVSGAADKLSSAGSGPIPVPTGSCRRVNCPLCNLLNALPGMSGTFRHARLGCLI